MIRGTVTASREAVVTLVVPGPRSRRELLEAVVDTGFDGMLTLPGTLIAALGPRWWSRGRASLADGSETDFDLHEARIAWEGETRRVLAAAVESAALVGMGLLEGSEMRIEVIDGGRVMIVPLPGR